MLTLEKFEEASEIVKRVTRPTKLIYSEYLSSQTGGKVYLKPENMQYTGAYKLRGAYYKISTLSEEDRAKGLRLFYTEMSMTMPVQRPMSLQKSTDILLYIRSMIWM